MLDNNKATQPVSADNCLHTLLQPKRPLSHIYQQRSWFWAAQMFT